MDEQTRFYRSVKQFFHGKIISCKLRIPTCIEEKTVQDVKDKAIFHGHSSWIVEHNEPEKYKELVLIRGKTFTKIKEE